MTPVAPSAVHSVTESLSRPARLEVNTLICAKIWTCMLLRLPPSARVERLDQLKADYADWKVCYSTISAPGETILLCFF